MIHPKLYVLQTYTLLFILKKVRSFSSSHSNQSWTNLVSYLLQCFKLFFWSIHYCQQEMKFCKIFFFFFEWFCIRITVNEMKVNRRLEVMTFGLLEKMQSIENWWILLITKCKAFYFFFWTSRRRNSRRKWSRIR